MTNEENKPEFLDSTPPSSTPYADAFAKAGDAKQDLFDRIMRQSGFPTYALPTPQSDLNLFLERIFWMNKIFQLDVNHKPTDLGVVRLLKFYKIIIDEVTELVECINDEAFVKQIMTNDPFLVDSDDPKYIDHLVRDWEQNNQTKLTVNMVALADTLIDITVYDYSEMVRWGIPAEECSHAVMESQITKLDDNGKPIMAEDGSKFIKGPYFQPPEPRIKEILEEHSK